MTVDRLRLPYTGIPSFLRSPVQTELDHLDADFAILGVPTDDGGPWKPGARFAPRSIREQSVRFATSTSPRSRRGYFDIDEGRRFLEHEVIHNRIVDCGDVDITYTNRQKTFEDITSTVRSILQRGAKPVVFGGDHGITYPVVRAYDAPMSVVQFDAHIDFGMHSDTVQFSNGMPMRLISELPHVTHLVQAGIRSLRTNQDDLNDARKAGLTVLSMKQYRAQGVASILDPIPQGSDIYITIDIDAFDLPLVPGCASAELGGFLYDELRDAVFSLIQHANVVGFDIVEINPMLDVASGATSLVGAQLAVEIIARMAERSGQTASEPR